MLIISEEQFLKELSQSNSKSMTIVEELNKVPEVVEMENGTYDTFRKPAGIPNIPDELKPIIGSLASLSTHEEVSEAFGVSKDTVSNLANDNHKNSEVSERKVNILNAIKDNIQSKIGSCVEFLEISKAMTHKELLGTAESLSRIHRNISPNAAPEVNQNAQFVFYVPERQNKVEDYTIIDAPV